MASLLATRLALLAVLQQPERVPADPPAGEPLHPSVLSGIRRMAHEHVRIGAIGLSAPLGDPEPGRALVDEALAALPEGARSVAAEGPLATEDACEILLAFTGSETIRAMQADARERGRPLAPADLLDVVWSDRLRELPDARHEPEVVAFVRRAEELAGKELEVRLWWPSVGYLLFGALHEPSFWPQRDDEREIARATLVMDLLAIATSSRDPDAAKQVVDVALTAPLEVSGKRPREAATCARGPLAPLRGRVGFTAEHLRYVCGFIEDGHPLAGFLAELKLRMLQELDPASIATPGPASCKHGTVEESLAYYQAALEQRGIDSFWVEARGDVEKMLEGRFAHALDPRIRALELRLADASLGDDERARLQPELAGLVTRREREQERIARFLTFQLGDLAPADLVVDELRRLEGQATPVQQQSYLGGGWAGLALRDEVDWAKRLVEARLDHDTPTSLAAMSAAAIALRQRSSEPECARALLAMAADGTPNEREFAARNSEKLPQDLARGLYELYHADLVETLQRHPDAQANRMRDEDQLYTSLLRATIKVLRGREQESWAREALLATFEHGAAGMWSGGSPFAADIAWGNREVLEWVARTLPSADFARLRAAGRIPDALARVHDELRDR